MVTSTIHPNHKEENCLYTQTGDHYEQHHSHPTCVWSDDPLVYVLYDLFNLTDDTESPLTGLESSINLIEDDMNSGNGSPYVYNFVDGAIAEKAIQFAKRIQALTTRVEVFDEENEIEEEEDSTDDEENEDDDDGAFVADALIVIKSFKDVLVTIESRLDDMKRSM